MDQRKAGRGGKSLSVQVEAVVLQDFLGSGQTPGRKHEIQVLHGAQAS
jgi:hypothetical protein